MLAAIGAKPVSIRTGPNWKVVSSVVIDRTADGRAGVRSHHPVVIRFNTYRSGDFQLRLADRITAFAGSMPFVYIHAIAFALWMLVFEKSPWPTLTLAVSLEAIFLSCFVMIGQNRQAAFQQAKADHEFAVGEQELKRNTELTQQIHELTREVHEHVVGGVMFGPNGGSAVR